MNKIGKIILSSLIILSLFGCQTDNNKEEKKQQNQVEKQEEKEIKKTSITLSFVGDIKLGNYAGQGYSGSFDQ